MKGIVQKKLCHQQTLNPLGTKKPCKDGKYSPLCCRKDIEALLFPRWSYCHHTFTPSNIPTNRYEGSIFFHVSYSFLPPGFVYPHLVLDRDPRNWLTYILKIDMLDFKRMPFLESRYQFQQFNGRAGEKLV